MKEIRTRYAPSPTGMLHIGGARTALFSYIFARKMVGEFIFRIDDTDQKRNQDETARKQFNDLIWLGIIPDESKFHGGEFAPYQQSKRQTIYQKYIKELLGKNMIYFCFCSQDKLNNLRNNHTGKRPFMYPKICRNLSENEIKKNLSNNLPYVIRFKIPNKKLQWNSGKGTTSSHGQDLEDFVIQRSDKTFTYNFTTVIDDYLMKISHVIRGYEHLTNTAKQVALYDAFGWEKPIFIHTNVLVNDDYKKLSKRDAQNHLFIDYYRKMGFLPSAVFNFLALLGWSSPDNIEIMSENEIIKKFEILKLKLRPAKFNYEKLIWFNRQYIQKLTDNEFIAVAESFITKNIYAIKNWKQLVLLFKKSISYFLQIEDEIYFYFINKNKNYDIDKQKVKELDFKNVLQIINHEIFKKLDDEAYIIDINLLKKIATVSTPMFFKCCRFILTGHLHGPPLQEYLNNLNNKIIKQNIIRFQDAKNYSKI